MQRIYILPGMVEEGANEGAAGLPAVVYAPIPLSRLSERDVRHLTPREAWIASSPARTHTQHAHSHGRIGLPISPDEGLLPSPREK